MVLCWPGQHKRQSDVKLPEKLYQAKESLTIALVVNKFVIVPLLTICINNLLSGAKKKVQPLTKIPVPHNA